ncbi:MAG: sulfurtransferase TusA family protein [Deltaproteobacteria bacterium]|nr:sulfurtransferase TusA family protein [Deltaproteobacteria bacterium]
MNSERHKKVVECDVRGQICPSTLLTALRTVNQHREALRRGDLAIVILTDHRDAIVTIPEAAANMGYRTSVTREAGHYCIEIQAGSAAEENVP